MRKGGKIKMEKTISKNIPGFMSLAVAGKAIKMVPKDFTGKKKVKKENFIKDSAEILASIPMIGAVSNQVAKL